MLVHSVPPDRVTAAVDEVVHRRPPREVAADLPLALLGLRELRLRPGSGKSRL